MDFVEYLQTWKRSDGAYMGLGSTYWHSSFESFPHTYQNSYVVQAYLNLFDHEGDDIWLKKAKEAADWILSTQQSDGLWGHSYGDLPGKDTGPVLMMIPDIALLRLYAYDNEKKYIDAAKANLTASLEKWYMGFGFSNQVANHNMKLVEVLMSLYLLEQDQKYMIKAKTITDRVLTLRIDSGYATGALRQGLIDDRAFTCYNSKCLPGLMGMFDLTGDENYRICALDIVDYLNRMIDKKTGLFKNSTELIMPFRHKKSIQGSLRKMEQNGSNIAGIAINAYKAFWNDINRWHVVESPIWIARSASIFSGMERTTGNIEYIGMQSLLNQQYEHGGFPNAFGLDCDVTKRKWTDLLPITRWNSQCFEYLTKNFPKNVFKDKGDDEIFLDSFDDNNKPMTIHEDSDRISFIQGNRKLKSILKRGKE